jgi:uncharacterized membrane protein YgdD (TMEM256/DUF423 family)
MRKTLLAGALLGFLAVALGAFGAHALKPRLLEAGHLDAWQTAAHYQLVHAVLLVALALPSGPVERSRRLASGFLIAGVLLFSGSLYMLCLTGLGPLGAITPLGGLGLLAGWGCLFTWGLGRRTLQGKAPDTQMNA